MKRQKVKVNHSSSQKRHKVGLESDSKEELNTETTVKQHVEGIEAYQNEAALETETSATLVVCDIESDGVADIHVDTAIGSRRQPLTNTTTQKLLAGFGFTTETRQYRHVTGRSTRSSRQAYVPAVYEKGKTVGKVTDEVDVSPSNINNQVSNEVQSNITKTYATVVRGANNQQFINTDNDNELVATNQACTGKRATTEQKHKSDIEMDVIYTRKLRERKLDEAPESVPSDYVDISPNNQPTEYKMTFICMIPIGRKVKYNIYLWL